MVVLLWLKLPLLSLLLLGLNLSLSLLLLPSDSSVALCFVFVVADLQLRFVSAGSEPAEFWAALGLGPPYPSHLGSPNVLSGVSHSFQVLIQLLIAFMLLCLVALRLVVCCCYC